MERAYRLCVNCERCTTSRANPVIDVVSNRYENDRQHTYFTNCSFISPGGRHQSYLGKPHQGPFIISIVAFICIVVRVFDVEPLRMNTMNEMLTSNN